MKKNVLIPFVLMFVLLLVGCTNQPSALTNDQADINTDQQRPTINNTNAEPTVNSNQQNKQDLPAGFPKDVYVMEGNITKVETAKNGYALYYDNITQPLETIANLYKQKLSENGWTVSETDKMLTTSDENGTSLFYSKGSRSVSLIAAKDPSTGKIQVILSYADLSDLYNSLNQNNNSALFDEAEMKVRDAMRVADIKEIQSALEMYYYDKKSYPVSTEPLVLNGQCLSSEGGISNSCQGSTYIKSIPANPSPSNDGNCPVNNYVYTSDSKDYLITFCLGTTTNGVTMGQRQATSGGIK